MTFDQKPSTDRSSFSSSAGGCLWCVAVLGWLVELFSGSLDGELAASLGCGPSQRTQMKSLDQSFAADRPLHFVFTYPHIAHHTPRLRKRCWQILQSVWLLNITEGELSCQIFDLITCKVIWKTSKSERKLNFQIGKNGCCLGKRSSDQNHDWNEAIL